MTTIVLTSGTSWASPGDWNTTTNTIEAWGAGAGGGGSSASSSGSGGGGGGGEYRKINNFGSAGTFTIQIGAGGAGGNSTTPTNGTDGTNTFFNTTGTLNAIGGKGGGHGNGNYAGGVGGTGGTGSGGNADGGGGGSSNSSVAAGGGGGAGGSFGIGGTGGAGSSGSGGAGGTGDGGVGGAGGAGGLNGGGVGGSNQEGGGGGGGSGDNLPGHTGGAGGLPGGGGGGGDGNGGGPGGAGAGGQIRIIYTPVATGIGGFTTAVPSRDAYPRGNNPTREHNAKIDFTGWQRPPLADSGPPEMALGSTDEVPYNDRERALRRHSMQGWQQSPLSAAFVNASPPEPVYELPQRGRQKNSFVGWFRSPLSDDSLPEIRQQPYYVPERDRNILWAKHSFQGFQAAPLVPELDIICRWWYDLPMRTWVDGRHSYQGLQVGPLAPEHDVPLPLTTLPVETWRSGSHSFVGLQAGPLPEDVMDPPIQPSYDLPVRTWVNEDHDYQGFQLSPQPEIMSPPPPYYDVPRGRFNNAQFQSFQKGVIPDEHDVPLPQTALPPVGRLTKEQYEGTQHEGIRTETLQPARSSMHFDLPPASRASSWRMQQAYVGITAAPTPGNVVPPIPHMWLPLIGVGNGGP